MVKDAVFTSVWDGGSQKIATKCKVNTETKEVSDIEMVDIEGVDALDTEYITIDDIDYPVSRNKEETAYWYQ